MYLVQGSSIWDSEAMQKKSGEKPTSVGAAVRLIAELGGYLGRSNDPPPGHQIMWRGYTHLQSMCEGYMLKSAEGA